jgi:hypothetical protein
VCAQQENAQPARGGDGQIPPVAEGGGRYRADEQVADDAAADRGDHGQPRIVEPGDAQPHQRAVEGEHEGARQVEDEEEDRLVGPWEQLLRGPEKRPGGAYVDAVGVSQARAATTRAWVPMSRVGWMTGAKRGLWFTGMSVLTRPASTAFW